MPILHSTDVEEGLRQGWMPRVNAKGEYKYSNLLNIALPFSILCQTSFLDLVVPRSLTMKLYHFSSLWGAFVAAQHVSSNLQSEPPAIQLCGSFVNT